MAIKLLPLEVSADPKFAERFVREARAMAKLSHPSIISVFDFGTTSEGHLFFVMEFVEGANLSEIIRGPGLAPNQALVIAGQVCTALAYAHSKGVIHRDIKPANVMVNTEGLAKVADFGLARLTGPNIEQIGHTVTGTVMGTPEYMSPEQKHGATVDHRADIFSMGVMLYEMLCKEPPQGAFDPPSQRAGCDAGIDQIVLKAMHRTPEGRYQSTAEMKADLDAAWQRQAAGTPLPARPHHHLPAPRTTSVHRPPYVPRPQKSHAGQIVTFLVAGLVVAGGIYYLNDRKKSNVLPVASDSGAQKATQDPTPVNELDGASGAKKTADASASASTKENPQGAPGQPLSGPKDLLATVDVARDAVNGQWQKIPKGLQVRGDGQNGLLSFDYVPPDEYDFEIEFTIQDGNREVSQLVSHLGSPIVWRMGNKNGDPTIFSFGDKLDGQPPDASDRTEAVARLPRLKANQRYRSMIEVRRNSLRALLDGEEVLRWTGDFKRLQMEDLVPLPDPQKLGVAVWSSTVLFHTAIVRPPGITTLPPPPAVKSPTVTNVAIAPAVSALVAASNDPRLVQLQSAFEARFNSDVQKPYLSSIAGLNESYLANGLARIRPAARARGDLNEVTAVDAEKAAIEKGDAVPAVDAPGTPDSLKTLRASYRTAMKKYTATRSAAAAQLYDLYLVSLDEYVRDLTRANNIERAKSVKAVRDEIAAIKSEFVRPAAPEPGASEPVQSETGSSPSATAPTTKTFTNATVREAAEWLFANGGKCAISKGTLEGNVLAARGLPAGKFEIVDLTLNKRVSKLPAPSDADMQILRAIKTLRGIWVYCPGLGDAAFEFLADNDDLTKVSLETEALTDGVLSHLAATRKLADLSILRSKNFTGQGLKFARWLRVLTDANFAGCAISDEGLKELVAAQKLHSLSLAGGATTATDAGIASIATYRDLSDLTLDGCKGVTDAGFAALARLKTLRVLSAARTNFGDAAAAAFAGHSEIRNLVLNETALTDAGLAKLASLKKLEILNLYGTNVTPAGIEAFKGAVPKCQVLF